MDKIKLFKIVMLSCVIVTALVLIIYHRDTLFTNRVEFTYPDGCKEVYVNTELVGSKCDYNDKQVPEYYKWFNGTS